MKLTKTLLAVALFSVLGLANASSVLANVTSVTVNGDANPWLAGMPSGSIASGDSVPQPPVEVIGLDLSTGGSTGGYLTFSATGATSFVGACPGPTDCFPADGDVLGQTNYLGGSPGFINRSWAGYAGENGITDATAPLNSLIGVYLDNSQPDSTAAPSDLDFRSSSIGLDFSTLSPGLKQAFFIGDGLTSTGGVQQFYIPVGATRLYLGTMDGFGWTGNNGTLLVSVSAVPEPETYGMLLAGLGLVGFAIRQKTRTAHRV